MKTCFWLGLFGYVALIVFNNKTNQQVTLKGTMKDGEIVKQIEYDVEINLDDCLLLVKKSTTNTYKDQEARRTNTTDWGDFTYFGDKCSVNKIQIGTASFDYNPIRGWMWKWFNLRGYQTNGLYKFINSNKIKEQQVPE